MKNVFKPMLLVILSILALPLFAQSAAPSAVDVSGIESIVNMVLKFVTENFSIAGLILGALAGLIVLGRTYIAMSPSKSDDAWLQKMESKPYIGMALRVLAAFSPVQRKDK